MATHTPMMSTAMATLVLTLLDVPFPTAVAAKTGGRNCSATCGGQNYGISYPLAIGPECSLPGFDLTCGSDKYNISSLFLGNTSIRVLHEFREDGYPYPAMLISVGYFLKMTPGVRNYYVHWEAPRAPFAISGSSNMSFFVVGCDIEASLFVRDSGVKVGDCSAACVEDQIMGRLPSIFCVGVGCCRIDITVNLRAFTLSISRTGEHARLVEQVNAFITHRDGYRFQVSDLQFDLSDRYDTELSWAIPYQPNCERAMWERGSYACVSDYSKCLDSPIGGYVCECTEGFTGNPYIPKGCVSNAIGQVMAVTTSEGNCTVGCGNSIISYPFGLGLECSLPGFDLTCVSGKYNISGLFLGNASIQVLHDQDHPYPASILTRIGYFVNMTPGVRDYSFHWEAPGRPFAISASSNMSLFIVGCDIKASLFVRETGVQAGDCSVACLEDQIMDRLPQRLCVGIGCCHIDITVNLRAFILNISRIGKHAQLLEQVNAFITHKDYYWFQSSDLRLDLTGEYATELSWSVPYQPNCKHAMKNNSDYACISDHSECLDSPIGGYVCDCVEGFIGNPYILNGCVEDGNVQANYDSTQPKADCRTSCGNLSVPFPFGMEVGCFAKLQLYLACNPGPSPPILVMPDGSVVTKISIDEGTLHVVKLEEHSTSFGHLDPTVYTFSGEWGVVKWVVDNMTCKDAVALKNGYRCVSHSDCVDVTGNSSLIIGYRCKCSLGFEGNPYIEDGCTDINECQHPGRYVCNGICHNTFGSYTCTGCPHGTDFSYSTRKCKTSSLILGVTVGLSSGGGLLVITVIVAVLTRRWKRNLQKQLRKIYFRKNKGILLEQLISCDQNASDGTKIFSLDELEKATNNFDHARVLGRGGHGTVYKGILTDQRVVAIKRSTKLEASSEIEQFINEVSILSQINHRNVVKLHGCCLEAEVPLLVYEFISNGTLYDLLHREQADGALFPLPWEERLRIAAEVAGALTYLHSAASVSILHRDVKCMNVLLNDSYTAKVSDFGASRSIPIDQTHLVTAVQGTFGYLDPEYYHTGQLNEKSDVYSFGVILLELLTRRKPIFENENGEKQNLSNYFMLAVAGRPVEEVVDAQILGDASEEAIDGMARLATDCLSLTRVERPTMKDVEMRLQMLRARHAVAPVPRARKGEEAVTLLGGGIPVPAGHQGSRQYSLEMEFVSSSRVPR